MFFGVTDTVAAVSGEPQALQKPASSKFSRRQEGQVLTAQG